MPGGCAKQWAEDLRCDITCIRSYCDHLVSSYRFDGNLGSGNMPTLSLARIDQTVSLKVGGVNSGNEFCHIQVAGESNNTWFLQAASRQSTFLCSAGVSPSRT